MQILLVGMMEVLRAAMLVLIYGGVACVLHVGLAKVGENCRSIFARVIRA